MVRRTYDKDGNLLSVQKSDVDVIGSQVVMGMALTAGAILTLLVLPFIPILWSGLKLFQFLNLSWNWHELFAGLFSITLIIAIGFALWKVRWLRLGYFGLELVYLIWITFLHVSVQADKVWATFLAIIIGVAGAWIIYKLDEYLEQHY